MCLYKYCTHYRRYLELTLIIYKNMKRQPKYIHSIRMSNIHVPCYSIYMSCRCDLKRTENEHDE